MKKETSITLPLGLAKALMQSAYWPSINADIFEAVGSAINSAMVDARQEALDAWFLALADEDSQWIDSDTMLARALAAWARGSRPGGGR